MFASWAPFARHWPVGLLFVVLSAGAATLGRAGDQQQPAIASRPAMNTGQEAGAADNRTYSEAELLHASGLIGSKHDFSRRGQQPKDLCLPCHAAHITAAQAPLLDHRPAATQPIRPYQSVGAELNKASLLCLGCHDGVAAPDIYSGVHATRLAQQLGSSQLGITGLQSHPIGVQYPVADPKFNAPAAVQADGLLLPDGRIQCTTCHDPHNTGRHGRMLVISNDRSRLCLSCHRL